MKYKERTALSGEECLEIKEFKRLSDKEGVDTIKKYLLAH